MTESLSFQHQFRVGWSDLDGNAHMGNTSYLAHASDTRMLFFAQHGFTLARFASEKFGPVVMRDELVYRKELRLMDEFTVDFQLVGLSEDGVPIPCKEYIPEPNQRNRCNGDISGCLVRSRKTSTPRSAFRPRRSDARVTT